MAATLELLSDEAENIEVDAETITAASASSANLTKPETLPEVMEVASAPSQGAFWSQTMTDLIGMMGDASILPNSSGKKKKAPIVVHRVLTSDGNINN